MRIARITAGCIAASLIPLTIAATPSVAAPTTAPTAKVKFRAPQGPALVRIDAPSATVVAKNPAKRLYERFGFVDRKQSLVSFLGTAGGLFFVFVFAGLSCCLCVGLFDCVFARMCVWLLVCQSIA